MNFQVINFVNKNGMVKNQFHCHKNGISYSPNLEWKPVMNAKCYSLIMEDPDATKGTFVHWFLPYINKNIHQIDSLKHNKNNHELLQMQREYILMNDNDAHVIQGMNSGGYMGFYPPCPPSGKHRYIFTILALGADTKNLGWDKKIFTISEWKDYLQKNNIPIIDEESQTFFCNAYN